MMNLKKRFSEQLDARRIIANSIAFQDFLRCFLSRPQKALLFHQRTRIGSLDLKTGPLSSQAEEEDPLGDFTSAKFEKDLINFEPITNLDKNLLLGVLFEKGIVQK